MTTLSRRGVFTYDDNDDIEESANKVATLDDQVLLTSNTGLGASDPSQYQFIDLLCHRAAWVRFGQSQWIIFKNFNPIEPPDWPQPTPMAQKVD